MDKKISIGLFCDSFYPMVDGVVNVVDNYASRLAKIANVTVFTLKGKTNFDDSKLPYKVVRCKSTNLPHFDYAMPIPKFDKNFKRELKNSHLDIVHIHSPFFVARAGIKYAKKHNIPVVATNHTQFKKDIYQETRSEFLTKAILSYVMHTFNSCDENWAVNAGVAKLFKEYGLKQEAKVENNATDMRFCEDEGFEKDFRAQFGVSDGQRVLLYVGRMNKLKNIYFLLDVAEELKKRKFPFKMLFVGTGQEDENMKKRVEQSGLEEEVLLLGKISDREKLAKLFKFADLFVFPSLCDCSSIVQIEAASQKTPTLFARGAITASTVTENVNGYLATTEVKDYCDKIVEIFADEKTYKQICENAYRDLYVHWDDEVQRVYEKYLKLIEDKKGKMNA
jgi:glycosyltransferase involved in cell wall biosynthesis